MAAFLTAEQMLTLLFLSCFMAASAGQRIITAKPGEDVILPCRAAGNKDVVVVEWTRTDLESEYVLLYRDERFVETSQSPSFKNRVDLKDVQNRDVSLVVKNLTTNDTGIYECRVDQGENNRRKRSNQDPNPKIIGLMVEPGNKDGGNKDGGNKDGGNKDRRKEDGGNKDGGNKDRRKEDGGNKDGGNKDGGNKDGGNKDGGNHTGLMAGLSVVGGFVLGVVVGVLMIRRRQIRSSRTSNPPPAEEAEVVNMVTGP